MEKSALREAMEEIARQFRHRHVYSNHVVGEWIWSQCDDGWQRLAARSGWINIHPKMLSHRDNLMEFIA